ncbi:MAG: argininosuccinate lyase [bacterium]
MTLWQADGEVSPDEAVLGFTSSLAVDRRLYPYDIRASIAWARSLADVDVLSESQLKAIVETLTEIKEELDRGELELDPELEDIHMNIEEELTRRLPEDGPRLHFGRSRNDQILVDVKLYLRDEVQAIQKSLSSVLESLAGRAREHQETYLPGFTHLQPAQPISLAHYLMAYFQKFRRDFNRLQDCYRSLGVMPLGSGALAGSGVEVDRELLVERLDFSTISKNSLDAVSERDFMVDIIHALTQLSVHASRLCEDWILWSSPGFGFCQFADEFTTGSSIMPQKQNPDVAELIRGQTGRLTGALQGLLTVLKAQPLAYNRDLQEDKVHTFRAVDCVKSWLDLLGEMITTVEFKEENMLEALEEGYPGATDLADYLVNKGIAFRRAHNDVRKLVQQAVEDEKRLDELELSEYKNINEAFEQDVFELLSPEKSVARRNLPGGTGPVSVNRQLEEARSWLVDHGYIS